MSTSSINKKRREGKLLVALPLALALAALIGYLNQSSSVLSSEGLPSNIARSLAVPSLGVTPSFNVAVLPGTIDPGFQLCTTTSCQFSGVDMFNSDGPVTSQSLIPFSNSAVPTLGSPSGLTSTLNYYIATTQKQVTDSLSAEAKISGSYLGYKASAEVQYKTLQSINSTTVHALLSANHWTQSYSFIDPIFKDEALNLLASSPEAFVYSYGTHFVDKIYKGCSMTIDMNIITSSSQTHDSLAASLSASYKGLSFGIEASGKIKTEALKQDQKSVFSIALSSNNGLPHMTSNPDDLPSIYNEFITKCEATAPIQMASVQSYMNIPSFVATCAKNQKCMDLFTKYNSITPSTLATVNDARISLLVASQNMQALVDKEYLPLPPGDSGFVFNSNKNQCGITPATLTSTLASSPQMLNDISMLIDAYPQFLKDNNVAVYKATASQLTTRASNIAMCMLTPKLTITLAAGTNVNCKYACTRSFDYSLPNKWKGAECI